MPYAISIQLNEKQQALIDGQVKRFCALPIEAVDNVDAKTKVLFQNWFASKPPNKNGWPTTGFWQKQRDSVHSSSTSNNLGAEVRIGMGTVGLRQRLLGGTITAGRNISKFSGKPTKYLTIPARAEAYGKRSFDFSNLRVLFGRGGKAIALVEADATKVELGPKNRKTGARSYSTQATGGAVMFWLVTSVTQQADPSVLPPTESIGNTVIFALSETADKIAKGEK